MGLVAKKDVLKFLGIDGLSIEDKNIDLIIAGVEEWIQSVYCHRDFESTDYKERYDGTDTDTLYLDYYPIISLNRLSIWTDDAIRIKNTSTGAHASVSVTPTNVVLFKDGTTNTLPFTTYTTLTTLVAAINAISGWSSSLELSSYGTYPSTILLEKYGLQCIASNEVSLEMPDEGEDSFEVYPKEGKIVIPGGLFPNGSRNIYVEYNAGYATVPSDIQLATMILIKNLHQKHSYEAFGVTNYSSSGISASFEQDIPLQAKQILDGYRRPLLI